MRDRPLKIEAAVLVAAAALAVRALPYRLWSRLPGPRRPSSEAACAAPASPSEAALAARVGRAVTAAARRLPFEAVCLPQAMAAHWMLSRRGVDSRLWFGVLDAPAAPGTAPGNAPAPDRLHAWVEVAGAPVVGGAPGARFRPLVSHGRPRAAAPSDAATPP